MRNNDRRRNELSQEQINMRKIKRKRKKKLKRIFFLVFFIAMVFLISLFTPIYNLKEIIISGNENVTNESVISAISVPIGTNVWKINLKSIHKSVTSIPYVKDAIIKRKLPGRLTVSIEESSVCAYISGDTCVAIDENNKILGTVEEMEAYPVIEGIELKEIIPGRQITIDDENKFDIIKLYTNELKSMDKLSMITKIDVSDAVNVKVTVEGRIVAIMGDTDKLQYKLSFLFAGFNTFMPDQKGELDLTALPRAPFTPY